MLETLHRLDCQALKMVHDPANPLLLNHFMGVFSDYRIWVVISALILGFGVRFKDKRYYLAWIWIAVCIGLSDFTSAHILKTFFERARPCLGECISALRWACGSYYSFPSSHATNAMSMVTVALFFLPNRKLNFFLLVIAFMIGLSRVYFGVHYPGDVLAGFIFGSTIAGLATIALKFALNRFSSSRIRLSESKV